MNIPGNRTENRDANKRPELLTILCILSFIGSGLAAFSNLFVYLSFDDVTFILEEYKFDFPEFDMILSGGKKFFIAGFVLYTLSLTGAIQMWKLRKIGFHIYTAAQVFILILPFVAINSYQFSILSILVTGAFIFGYFSQTKIMT